MKKKKPFEREPANEEWVMKNIDKLDRILPELADNLRELKRRRAAGLNDDGSTKGGIDER